MLYCTNCGEKTSEKKICEKCEVKLDSTHNYCKWCGCSIVENAKKCPQCKQKLKKESIIGKIICYIVSAIFLIASLGMFAVNGAVSAICFILFAVLLFPAVKKIFKKTADKSPKSTNIIIKVRALALVVFLIVGFAVMPETESSGFSFGKSSNDASASEPITSESQALKAADDYLSKNEVYVNQLISSKLGFETFYAPKYGGKEVVSRYDYWNVTYYGNMTGYTDKYQTDIEIYKFSIILTVKEDGNISVSVFKN